VARATMSEVASLAGVSMKSVSRVINNEPNVSDKLRARVQGAIDALGYVPDVAARSLAGMRAYAIGLLFDDYDEGFMPTYFPKMQTGAYRACRRAGYHLVIESIASNSPDFATQLGQMLDTMRVDGIIVAPPYSENDRAMAILEARRIPFVRIAPDINHDRSPYVTIDDKAAASELTRYLWALGHRRFGFVAGRSDHHAARARHEGFVETMASLGNPDFAEVYAGFEFAKGITAAHELMAMPDPPTAIFAANDDSAAGVMSGLAQLGLKVPDDVSVAGFDDSWIAQSVWPYLTTMHQPIAQMGEVAASMLILRNGQMEHAELPAIETRLIVRGSTAPPKNQQ
jgi:LacI family transcriptional regulator